MTMLDVPAVAAVAPAVPGRFAAWRHAMATARARTHTAAAAGAGAARRTGWRVATVALCLWAAGCSSQPPVPDWKRNASAAADKAVAASLSGDGRIAQLEWNRARQQTARTGQITLLARLELLHCAAQVASLNLAPCAGFDALRADAAPAERAYADYLAGRATAQTVPLLPPAQQNTALVPAEQAAQALAAITDPLSRLVAAGVLLHTGRAHPDVIALATDTASAQGWRRPLMAWLLLQAQRADAAGDTEEAARLRRRIHLVERSGAKP